ncbi:MAG: AAC(3) family N-acetyltransferase [Candidatus Competibacteraceae bacterium]
MNLIETVSGLAVRHLKQEQLLALRVRYLSLRTKLYPVMRLVYGTFDTAALRTHLEQRIGTQFEILMVHSSVNNMKPMYTGNPLELLRMLMAFCGPDRTLVMPAFYFGDPEIGGTVETFAKNPRFDVRRTPSQMGLVTELFRRSKGVVQSRNPVYRVAALGPLAAALTQGHERTLSPAGRGSPFDFMANHDTCIIGIGKPFQVLTQVHHAEEVMGADFPVPGDVGEGLSMTLIDGTEEIPFRLTKRSLLWRFNIWKLRTIMDRDSLQEWTFHHVPMFATRAGAVTTALVEAAKRGVTLYDRP